MSLLVFVNKLCLQQQLCLYQEYVMLKNGRWISVGFPSLPLTFVVFNFKNNGNHFIIILLFYKGKDNSVLGNAAMLNLLPFR